MSLQSLAEEIAAGAVAVCAFIMERSVGAPRVVLASVLAASTGLLALGSYWIMSGESGPPPPTATVLVTEPVPASPQASSAIAAAPARVDQPMDRGELTRALQTELRSAGCYDGKVTRRWTPAAQASMKEFTRRVNAVLPVNEPDEILLTLVRAHPEACKDAEDAEKNRENLLQRAAAEPVRIEPAKAESQRIETGTVESAAAVPPPAEPLLVVREARAETKVETPAPSSERAAAIVNTPKPPREAEAEAREPRETREVREDKRPVRNARKQKEFRPPPAARAVIKNLKKLERVLGGVFQ